MLNTIKYELHLYHTDGTETVHQYRLSQAAINDGREAMARRDIKGYEVIDINSQTCVSYDGKWWDN